MGRTRQGENETRGAAASASLRGGEHGSITPTILGLMVVLLTISLGILSLTQRQSQDVVDDGKHQTAIGLAEGGVDHVLWRLRQTADAQNHYGLAWRTLSDERDVVLGNGTYYLQNLDTDTSGAIKGLRMQGWVPDRTTSGAVSAEIYVEVDPIQAGLFSAALLGDQRVLMNGNPTIDSYKSSNGTYAAGPKYDNGDIADNNPAATSILINGTVNIKGHVYYPQGGSASTVLINPSNPQPTKGVSANPNDTTFKAIPAVPASATYIKTILGNGSTDVSFVTTANVTIPPPIPAGNYVITKDAAGNSITLNGTSQIRFAGTAQTVLYLEGNATINGVGFVNSGNRPTSLQVYGMTTSQRILYNGTNAFYGAIYAPQADVTLNGLAAYYGSIMGKTITGNGNITVHYDEDLGGVGGSSSGYTIGSWTEVR